MMAADEGSQDAEITSQIVIPSTPPPPPVQAAVVAEMTPPPSTQPPKSAHSAIRTKSPSRGLILKSPPSIRMGSGAALPTSDDIAKSEPDQLRIMAQELLGAVAEARMSTAHFKLQHSLLKMESEEAAQRAEIEHQMTKREVEVLQATEQRRSSGSITTPRSSQVPFQQQIDALKRNRKVLEDQKAGLEYRLDKAKGIIEREIDKVELLYEDNLMLKTRIRENREHFTMLRQSPAFSTPVDGFATPKRNVIHRYPGSARPLGGDRNQDPFAALLAADQVLNGEAVSVPSTPSRIHSVNPRQGHTRGAFSLSALQTNIVHPRSLAAVKPDRQRKDQYLHRPIYSAPSTQLHDPNREKPDRDRDSTISVSEEEALTEDDLPQSQASSLATSMLRRNPGAQNSSRPPDKVEKSSKVLQTKLFGSVKKAGIDRKRHASFSDAEHVKRSKAVEGVGLGIKA